MNMNIDINDCFENYGCIGGCLIILIVIGLFVGQFILLGWLFSLLWNFAMPLIFVNTPVINIWVGTAIIVIANLLFGIGGKIRNKED